MPHAAALLALLLPVAPLATSPAPSTAAPPGRLVAPPRACPGQRAAAAPARRQLRAMRCLTDFARRRAGRPPLAKAPSLDRSAALKSRDILRCESFSHGACGRDFTYWMRRTGYIDGGCWRAGENLAVGSGAYATPRAIFEGWLASSGHRRNILGDFQELGIGLRVGELGGRRRAHVWTQHLGSHRC